MEVLRRLRPRMEPLVPNLATVAVDVAAVAAVLASTAAGAAQPARGYVNATAGGPLRAGVYGRIELRGAPPPPVIHAHPVTAAQVLGPPPTQPVYWYVPAGHVRKWERHCGKYQACSTPVYFVRVDNSPSRLGEWKAKARAAQAQPGILHAFSAVRE